MDSLFLIRPSIVFPTAPLYMQLIIRLQMIQAHRIIFLDSLKHFAFKEYYSPLQYFPAHSRINCIEHPSSNQYELQQHSTKNIIETVTVCRNQNDRLTFERRYLVP